MQQRRCDDTGARRDTPAVSVVVVTRDRCERLAETLTKLVSPEGPPVIVVDNGSVDATGRMIRATFPTVELVELAENLGAAGRNIGVALSSTPYVAFSDDDSWWAPGALDAAATVFDEHRDVAVVTGPVLVGPTHRLDPVCVEMAQSPLPGRAGDPGPSVLGFLACGAVVRADAFLEVAGFDPDLGIGGEEELLALDLVAAGWRLVYVEAVSAFHDPAPRTVAGTSRRQRRQTRNAVRIAWLRLPARLAVRETARVSRSAAGTPSGRRGLADASGEWSDTLQRRCVVPPATAQLRRLL